MPISVLNTVLLIAAIVGGVLAYRVDERRRELLAEQRRLEKAVGRLLIEDPAKVYVRALETGEKLHFAWRVYLPAGFASVWREDTGSRSGSSYGTSSSSPREFIARIRFREDDEGSLEVFSKTDNASSRSSFGNRVLADLLRGRWDEIQVEQLGCHGPAIVEVDEVATLLRLTLPDDLKQEAVRKLQKYFGKRFQTDLFEMRFGSQRAFDRAAPGRSPGT